MSFIKSWKFKVFFPLGLFTLLFAAYGILWHLPVSEGRRTGNLTKFSYKGKFSWTKTWEGTIDEGSGDKLTSFFSVRDDKVAKALYQFEGRGVTIFYKEYLMGWPRETKYDVYEWKPIKNRSSSIYSEEDSVVDSDIVVEKTLNILGQTMFCSLLGSLYKDQELYQKVKTHLEADNLYLYKQISKCNE